MMPILDKDVKKPIKSKKKGLITLYQTYYSLMAKVYNFDTKRLPLGSNRLLPIFKSFTTGYNRLLPKSNRLPLILIGISDCRPSLTPLSNSRRLQALLLSAYLLF